MTVYIWHEPRGWCWGERFPDRVLSRFYHSEHDARAALLAMHPTVTIRTLETRQ